ncbi:predicted protein [Naegleria gruberi]|uniref:Predicted protein n=1 Tax=Naegleria gruberi TaxID=5762 RepID=D2UYR2_NAEGR|nr:uncharacterized protein NAEGRDRAFT_61559 [Naegleria gruberi]EFC50832.1 predicted protein [Naegleria gruberi]|eukprot:XP_002683576.1 predicted protein [Naegleria gruberi strain NEG-M]
MTTPSLATHQLSMRLPYELCLGREIPGVKNAQQGRITSDGFVSFVITEGRQVKIVDNETKLVVATFYSPSDINTCCYYSPSDSAGEILCCFTKEKELFTIDLSSGRKLRHFNLDYEINNCLAVENHLVVLTNNGIGLMDHDFNFKYLPLDNPTSIYYSKEKDLIIVGFESGKIIFYKILNNLLEKVFTQQLCNDSITSISINNIGKQHDFTLLVGTEANELVMFYFVDYFKSYQSKQYIDLRDYAEQLVQVKLVNIDKYSSLILLQDGGSVKLLIFNLNIWILTDQLESSLACIDIENLYCNILDVHVHDYVQYKSNNLTRLEISVLTNQSIHTITMKNDNTLIANPSLQKLLHQYRSNMNNLFEDLYNNNLISTLVEYIEGTVLNQEDLILPFNNDAPMSTSQSIKQRFIVHDIKDITIWIKNTQEYEFSELEKNLQQLLENTNRTTPPLVLQECKKVLQKSIRKLETLCLLIQSIIHRAKLIENVGDDYTPSLVKYKETITFKVEYAKTMIWLIQNGLLPMTSNIYNYTQLQTEWDQRKEQPFPINKINVSEDEFNSILNIMNLTSVDSDMVPTHNVTNTKNFLIEHMAEKCQVEYPPKDLKNFILQIYNSNISLQLKHLIIFYLIIDNNHSHSNGNDVSILNKYAKEFNIPAPYQHFAVGLWLLDTKRTQDSILNQAIHYLSNLFINNSESSFSELDEWVSSILSILIKSCSFNSAQRLLNILSDSTTSNTSDMDITTSSKYSIDSNIQVLIYLTNDMYHLAFDYCRSMEDESEKRRTFYCMLYYSLIGNCFIDLLSIFPFDEMESLWIEQYLKKEKKNELLLSYYIMNSNYIDAYHLSLQFNNNNLLAIIGNILPPIQKVKLDQNTADVKKNPLLKMGGRRINQPIFSKNGNQLKVINQLTSFKSWLDQNDKASTFTIPSLFDAASPKWIGKHRKHLLPSVEKQDLLYLPPNKMQIPEKMVDEDDESTTSSESEMGVKQTVTNDYVPPRSQYGQKTVRVSRPAEEDASSASPSEEEEEQSLMVNRLDYNKFKQVENQEFDNNKKDVFESSEDEEFDSEESYDEEEPEEYVISD